MSVRVMGYSRHFLQLYRVGKSWRVCTCLTAHLGVCAYRIVCVYVYVCMYVGVCKSVQMCTYVSV